jgi:hypothetical protein
MNTAAEAAHVAGAVAVPGGLTVPERPGLTTASDRQTLPTAYTVRQRGLLMLFAIGLGIAVAGFWNASAVDGFGRNVVAHNTIGDTQALAGSFTPSGSAYGFGFVFAVVAGLAATFTACNWVVYAMIPGLTCPAPAAHSRSSAGRTLGLFLLGVVAVGAVYGGFVGLLGPDGVRTFNERALRLAVAQWVFCTIGVAMLLWAAVELGFLAGPIDRLPLRTRRFFAAPQARATLMGLIVGFFAVGRPFPVFREFLTYAATAQSPAYGALVMAVQGLGQVAVAVVLFLLLVRGPLRPLRAWLVERPLRSALISALALATGGAFFVYYWGPSISFGLGRWGFRLGWYG